MSMRICDFPLPFICIEDVTGMHTEINTVVYNFALAPVKRLTEFKRVMEERFSHRFTEGELNELLTYEPNDARALIKLIRSYIFHP